MALTSRVSRRVALVICGLLLAPALPIPEVDAADWAPKDPPNIYDPTAGPRANRRTDFITDVCVTEAQLDCVESIAAQLNGVWVTGTPTDQLEGSSRLWEIPGLVNLNGTTKVAVTHRHNYTGNLFLTTDIAAVGAKGISGNRDDQSLPRDVPFRATVRTSWVLPTHIATKGRDVTLSVTKLDVSGASRITLASTPTTHMSITDDTSLTSPTGKGREDMRIFVLTVSDGRFYPIKKDCIEKPAIMTGENGYGYSLPTFKDGNLDLRVPSPHFRSDGVTKHLGIYEALIPMETAKCLWGNSIESASQFIVEVIETDGEEKSATTSIDVKGDGVRIRASGFTFSTPTIRVKAMSSSTTSSTSTTSTLATTTSSSTPSVVTPKKPTGIRTSASKGRATVSFTRVKGLEYSAVVVKGTTKKTLRCTLGATRVTCSATQLAKGRWKLTVTPRSGSVLGQTFSKTLSIT